VERDGSSDSSAGVLRFLRSLSQDNVDETRLCNAVVIRENAHKAEAKGATVANNEGVSRIE